MTIMVTGGGSGGHITPILAVAAELKRQQPSSEIVYVGQVGLAGGYWFYDKLGVKSIFLPGLNEWHIGIGIIILFWFVVTINAIIDKAMAIISLVT